LLRGGAGDNDGVQHVKRWTFLHLGEEIAIGIVKHAVVVPNYSLLKRIAL